MKAVNLFVTGLVLTLGLTACGAVKDAKNAENMQNQGNALGTQINAENKALESDDIYLTTLTKSIYIDWTKKTPEKRAELRKRLTAVMMNSIRYTEIGRHKDMKIKDGQGTWKAELVTENAKRYINSLDKVEGKTQTYPEVAVK